MNQKLLLYIEALIFIAKEPLHPTELCQLLQASMKVEIPLSDVEHGIESLKKKYDSEEYSYSIIQINEGYQFMTKASYHAVIDAYLKEQHKKRLSKAALETLAIIAYKQPVMKAEVEHIRGVNCDYTIQKLLEKDLIDIKGRENGPGKPLIYGTSERFMNYFGLASINDLPQLKEFEQQEETIGRLADIESQLKVEEE